MIFIPGAGYKPGGGGRVLPYPAVGDFREGDSAGKASRQKKEVGINDMKSWEWEKIFTERGRTEGRIEGRAEGLEQGRFLLLCEMVQSGDISLEKASGKMDLLPEKFADRMKEAGYV